MMLVIIQAPTLHPLPNQHGTHPKGAVAFLGPSWGPVLVLGRVLGTFGAAMA